jgi:ATP-dependent DNA helicase PIF1
MEEPVVVGCVNIEWLNQQAVVMKKLTYKIGMVKILRNDIREMFLEVSADKIQTTKLKLKNINVHKKFMNEGKASIKFLSEKCNVYISNSAPASLMLFLKTLYIKISKDQEENKGITKEQMHKKLREHLLSEKHDKFDEISPVTNAELDRAKKQAMSKSTVTTPSPVSKKRRLADLRQSDNPGAAKKLYAPSIASPLSKKDSNVQKKLLANPDEIADMGALNEEQNAILQGIYKLKFYFNTDKRQIR